MYEVKPDLADLLVFGALCHRRAKRNFEETVNTARGFRVGLQASVGRVQYLGNANTRRNWP